MANNGRITRSSISRMLQYGLDEIVDQDGHSYKGKGDKIFTEVKTDKAYWEAMQLSGVGMASRKGEGSAISFDSLDQHWVFRQPVYTYQKGVRVTREALQDNVYESLLPRIAREQMKALMHARDYEQARILNSAFDSSVTYGDKKELCSTSHPCQDGGTNSNRLAVDEDLSEAAIENLSILADKMVNDDGLLGDYELNRIIVPTASKFEVRRILKSDLRYATADHDANILKMDGVISEIIDWKRLSDSDAYFATCKNVDQGLMMVRREGIYTDEAKDWNTTDTIVYMAERYQPTVGDHRAVVGCPGA